MQFTDQPNVALALVYQSPSLHQHLRAALDEFGARVVYESATSAFDHEALKESGANVVLINLDPAIDEEIEQIEQLLFDDTRKVIFNDGEVTSKLSGWDLARWARHLVAKIMGDTQLLPARPIGSEAVSVRAMPQHGLDSTFKPVALQAPIVSSEAEDLAAREIGAALDSFSMSDAALIAPAEAARREFESALEDFGFFSDAEVAIPVNDLAAAELPEPVAAPSPIAEPEVEIATGIELLSLEDELATHDFPLAESAEVATESTPAPHAGADFNELFADFSFDEVGADPAASDDPINDSAAIDVQEDNDAFADINFDFDDAPPSAAVDVDAATGLDDLLAQHSYKQQDVTVELPTPVIAAPAKKPVDIDQLLSGLSLELSPIDVASVEAPVAAAAEQKPASAPLASSFDDILSSLSLQPMEDLSSESPGDVVIATAAATAATGAEVDNPFGNLDFGLEPLESELSADVESNPFAELTFASESNLPEVTSTVKAVGNPSPQLPDAGQIGRVWVLGASIGGPDAVREFLSGIPDNTGNLFVLAQHMGADFVELMVTQLAKATPLEVRMAASGAAARNGQVLVVPLAERMLLEADGNIRIVPLDEASPYSPSIDQVLFDIADRFGPRAGVIVFSGMAHDAIEGAKYLASKGGIVWAQDPSTCVVSSMIDGAIEAGIVRYQGSPAVLAQKFVSEFR